MTDENRWRIIADMKCCAILLTIITLAGGPGCARDNRLVTIDAYRDARAAGEYEAAEAYLGEDPRVWFEQREGPGAPLVLGGGRWASWDDHFRSASTAGEWHLEDDRAWAIVTETNDYYRLTGRAFGRYRHTYFFDRDGRIVGSMVSAAPDAIEPHEVALTTSRFDEFEQWAQTHEPEEFAYLVPDGRLDPTGDRPPRMRALLNAWRIDIGLEPIW